MAGPRPGSLSHEWEDLGLLLSGGRPRTGSPAAPVTVARRASVVKYPDDGTLASLMGRLTMRQRRALPDRDYAIPEKAPGPGSYPIEDRGHAQAALGEVKAHGSPWERRRVRRAVKARYGIGE